MPLGLLPVGTFLSIGAFAQVPGVSLGDALLGLALGLVGWLIVSVPSALLSSYCLFKTSLGRPGDALLKLAGMGSVLLGLNALLGAWYLPIGLPLCLGLFCYLFEARLWESATFWLVCFLASETLSLVLAS